MHTIVLHDKDGVIRGRIHHNADWSGDAYLCEEGSALQLVYPGELLRAAACSIALSYLLDVAEETHGERDVSDINVEDSLVTGHIVRGERL